MSMAVTGWACAASSGHTPSTASMRLAPAESAKARASADRRRHATGRGPRRRCGRRAPAHRPARRRARGRRCRRRRSRRRSARRSNSLSPAAGLVIRDQTRRVTPPPVAAPSPEMPPCPPRPPNPHARSPAARWNVCCPFWTSSRWRRTCFAAAARRRAGSASTAGRCWARRWSRPCAPCRPERVAHSLHAYFLLPGDPAQPIIYDVERVRDGGSFTTRRVTGIQHGRADVRR